jgi:hypothetical protein
MAHIDTVAGALDAWQMRAAAQTNPSALGAGVRRIATVCVMTPSGNEVVSFPIVESPAVLRKNTEAAQAIEAIEELLHAKRRQGMTVMVMVPEA